MFITWMDFMFVNYKKKSILSYGDLSATSLHATKILNSVEGGACISKNNYSGVMFKLSWGPVLQPLSMIVGSGVSSSNSWGGLGFWIFLVN